MQRQTQFAIYMLAFATLVLLPGTGSAQQKSLKEQLFGAWVLVSADQTAADGTKHQLFGPSPKGVMVLDPSGQYVQIFVRPGREKFKANNRLKGTPEENTAAVHATTASFGTWTVDEASKMLIVRVDGRMYPN